MTMTTAPTLGRRFVRAVIHPADRLEPGDAPDDDFFTGIVCAEFAAHHGEIDCASCGSPDVTRTPMRAPATFGTVTSSATGHLFGYALCPACCALRSTDPHAFADRMDAAFEGAS